MLYLNQTYQVRHTGYDFSSVFLPAFYRRKGFMKNIKFMAAVCASLSLALLLGGCGTTPVPELVPVQEETESIPEQNSMEDGVKAGVFYYSFSDTYLAGVRTYLDIALYEAGIQFVNYDAQSSQSVQSGQIDTALSSGINLLIVNLVSAGNTEAATEIIEKARHRNVRVIFFNKPIEGEDEEGTLLNEYDNIAFVGTDAAQSGHMQGQMIGEYVRDHYSETDLNGDGVISYALFKGEALNPEAIYRTRYSVEDADAVLEEAGYPHLEYFDPSNYDHFQLDLAGTWSDDAAKRYMLANLEEYGIPRDNMIELVICNNDNMAEGVIAALNEYGYNTGVEGSVTIPVFGVDATDYARQLIASGRMTGTIVQDAEKMAGIITHLAVNASEEKDLMEDVFSKFPGTESGIRNKVIIPYSFYDPEEYQPGSPGSDD